MNIGVDASTWEGLATLILSGLWWVGVFEGVLCTSSGLRRVGVFEVIPDTSELAGEASVTGAAMSV